MIERVAETAGSPFAQSGAPSAANSPRSAVAEVLQRLVGAPSTPGPLVKYRPFRAHHREVAEAIRVLEGAAAGLAANAPSRAAITRGIVSIRATVGDEQIANQAAYVLGFAEAMLTLSETNATPRALARALMTDQVVPILGRLRKDDSTGFIVTVSPQHAAKYGLREIAQLLGPGNAATALIDGAIARADKAPSSEAAQNILAAVIRDVSRRLG